MRAAESMVSDGSVGLLTDRRLRSEIDTLRKTLILGKEAVWESRQELVGLLGVLMAEQSRRVSRFIAPEVGLGLFGLLCFTQTTLKPPPSGAFGETLSESECRLEGSRVWKNRKHTLTK